MVRRFQLIESIMFYILAVFLLAGGIGVIWSKRPVFATFSFLLVMLALSGLYALLHLTFLFLTQVMIAVGAVVAVTLLVVSSINIKDEQLPDESNKSKWTIASLALIIPFIAMIFTTISKENLTFADIESSFGSLKVIGLDLFSKWVLPFELISILLLAVLIGAIITVRKGLKKI